MTAFIALLAGYLLGVPIGMVVQSEREVFARMRARRRRPALDITEALRRRR